MAYIISTHILPIIIQSQGQTDSKGVWEMWSQEIMFSGRKIRLCEHLANAHNVCVYVSVHTHFTYGIHMYVCIYI